MPQPRNTDTELEQMNVARAALYEWVFGQLNSEERQWLMDQLNHLALVDDFEKDADAKRRLDITFGLIPRRLGKVAFFMDTAGRNQASQIYPNWQPWRWQLDEAARILLLASCGNGSDRTKQIARLLRHADVSEQLAIFRGLPLYPDDNTLSNAIGEGLRSNMSIVFTAIAHNNPTPANTFDEHRFNHMVLKALFIDVPLHPIVGLSERNNAELTRMLLDYASERNAANRVVSWELWRLVASFASADMLEPYKPILSRVATSRDALLSQQGLALALSSATEKSPREWIIANSQLPIKLNSDLSWDSLLLESTGT